MMHPIQDMFLDQDADGRKYPRFRENAIVRFLLDRGPFDMNDLAVIPFSIEDREQFAMLIGYSLDGFSELSYVTETTYEAAEWLGREILNQQASCPAPNDDAPAKRMTGTTGAE